MAMPMELYATEWVYQQHCLWAAQQQAGVQQSKLGYRTLLGYGMVVFVTTALSLVLWFLLNRFSRKTWSRRKNNTTGRRRSGDGHSPKIRHLKNDSSSSSSSNSSSALIGRLPWKFNIPSIPVWSNNKRRAKTALAQIQKWFPGAMVVSDLVRHIQVALAPYNGYKRETAVMVTCLCLDDINRPFQQELFTICDHHFNLGGLAGVPFGGVAAFGEMARQIPNGGSCLVVYGPHVGIDSDGTWGTVRDNIKCCASAIAACTHVQLALRQQQQQQQQQQQRHDDDDYDPLKITQQPSQPHPEEEDNASDAQQTFVQNMLLPYANRLQCSEEIMAELPYVLYDAQTELMEKIVQKGCRQVAGEGKIALLGGIHINTPKGLSDYFLPLRFDILDNQGTVVANLQRGPPRAPLSKIASTFPRAMPNDKLLVKVQSSLAPFDFGKTNSLLCTSLCSCCNQVNRPLEVDLCEAFGEHFYIGGLAGFAFGGATGFAAMAMRIPDGGNCLIVYGPHVGVDSQGHIGTVDRRGRSHNGACCSSGIAALEYVESVTRGETQADRPVDPLDAQQTYVGDMLLPYADQLAQADDAMVELPFTLFQAQDKLVQKIVLRQRHLIPGRIALLGGIQINTPDGIADHFLPLRFEVLKSTGNVVVDLLYEKKVKDTEDMM